LSRIYLTRKLKTFKYIALFFLPLFHFLDWEYSTIFGQFGSSLIFSFPFLIVGILLYLTKQSRFSLKFLFLIFSYLISYFIYLLLMDHANFNYFITQSLKSFSYIYFLIQVLNSISNYDSLEFKKILKLYFCGIGLTFVLVVFIPIYQYSDFSLGSAYNLGLSHSLPFFQTTLDHPFISSIVFCVCFVILIYNVFNPIFKGYPFLRFFIIVLFLILCSLMLYLLLIINRRGPILTIFLALIFVLFTVKWRNLQVLLFLSLFSMTSIFFWDLFDNLLDNLSNNALFSALIVRNDYKSLSEATGRIVGWMTGLNMLSDLSFLDFFKYHKVIVLSTDNTYDHFHNGFLQIIYERGIFGFSIVILLIFRTFKNIVLRTKLFSSFIILLVFLFFMEFLLSTTESIFYSFQFTEKFFLFLVIFLEKGSYMEDLPTTIRHIA